MHKCFVRHVDLLNTFEITEENGTSVAFLQAKDELSQKDWMIQIKQAKLSSWKAQTVSSADLTTTVALTTTHLRRETNVTPVRKVKLSIPIL